MPLEVADNTALEAADSMAPASEGLDSMAAASVAGLDNSLVSQQLDTSWVEAPGGKWGKAWVHLLAEALGQESEEGLGE